MCAACAVAAHISDDRSNRSRRRDDTFSMSTRATPLPKEDDEVVTAAKAAAAGVASDRTHRMALTC